MTKPKAEIPSRAVPDPLTFDQVASARHEVTYEEVANRYGGPVSKCPVISVKAHPEAIWVRPDMGIAMVANPFAFAVGDPPRPIPWGEVRRSLRRGYLPIVTSAWNEGPLVYKQTAFAILLEASEVRTGREKQLAMVEMSIVNTDLSRSRRGILWAFVPGVIAAKGVPPFPYNTYDFFEVVESLPTINGDPKAPEDDILRDGSIRLGTHTENRGIKTLLYGNVFKFESELGRGEKKHIRFKVSSNKSGFSAAEINEVRKLDFLSVLDQRTIELERILKQGTQISVPEDVVNNIYKAQILYDQAQLVQAADRDYYVPVQGFQGVWPWEAMKTLGPFDAIGRHEDVEKCLEYFPKIQGRFLPQGEFKSSDGVFGGTIAFEESGWEKDWESTVYGQLAKLNAGREKEFPNWMNGTGSMLQAFGAHYFHTRNRRWLKRVAPALVRACDWIINERQQTKQLDAKGNKAVHFGLLPVGRAYDTADEAIRQLVNEGALQEGQVKDGQFPADTYYPCWTDSYSSQGLSCVAEALAEIGHPEGKRLVKEAKAYRRDIQEVLRRTRDKNPSHAPYPERFDRPPGWAEFATGALALVDTGFLDPQDAAFAQLEGCMKKKWNRDVVGLTGGLEKDGDPHGSNAYYVCFSEDIWHRAWLLRGEIEKALLAFYSMLAYGVDKETFGSVERFHLLDQRYAPFFMDTSGSARIFGLIRQALLMEDGKVIHLLPGAPRRWFEDKKEIVVKNGVTSLGRVNLSVQSQVKDKKILVDLALSEWNARSVEKIRLRVPHPARQLMKKVLVNGRAWNGFTARGEVIELKPGPGRYKVIVMY